MQTQTVAPDGTPCVGIYWGITDRQGHRNIIVDVSTLKEAESYGDFLTHPRGHYDVWEAWRRLGKPALAQRELPDVFRANDYEDFPRGRVVYQSEQQRFIVYADKRLQDSASIAKVVRAFQLSSQKYIVQSDAHYSKGWATF